MKDNLFFLKTDNDLVGGTLLSLSKNDITNLGTYDAKLGATGSMTDVDQPYVDAISTFFKLNIKQANVKIKVIKPTTAIGRILIHLRDHKNWTDLYPAGMPTFDSAAAPDGVLYRLGLITAERRSNSWVLNITPKGREVADMLKDNKPWPIPTKSGIPDDELPKIAKLNKAAFGFESPKA